MITYSTCSSCHGPLIVTDELDYRLGQRHHETCKPTPPPKLDWLCDQYIDAVESGNTKAEAELAERIWELQNQPPRLLEAALAYAQWGWPVFPLAACSKVPAIKGGHGVHDATTDAVRIRRHWSTHPDHNIGLATGHFFDVIDVDQAGIKHYHDAVDLAAATPDNRGPLPDCHGRTVTAHAGYHLYVRPSGRGNHARKVAPGIDYRGKGGYVVAPPSTLGEPGKAWSWQIYPSPMIKGQ